MMKGLLTSVLILMLFINGCTRVPEVTVAEDPQYPEKTYTVKDDISQMQLLVYTSGVNIGVLSLRAEGDMPSKKVVPWLKKILSRVLQDFDKNDFHTLLIGRLYYAFGPNNTDMSGRLAAGAYRSSLWNAETGKSVSGADYDAVKNICNSDKVYKELDEAFSKFGMLLSVSSIEKVLILKVSDMPHGDELLRTYPFIKDKARLPFDGITWLSVSPRNERLKQ